MPLERASDTRPLIVAHRGSSGAAPENTLAAFRQAVADGAEMIECDVRLTRDGHMVILHDRSVHRTTDGRGYVWNLTLDELRSLDAGSWFDKRFDGERIPTLHEVLECLPPGFPINIEVKTDGQPNIRPSFEERLASFIAGRKLYSRVLVSSFDHAFLRRLHGLDPRIRIGVLYTPLRDMTRTPSGLARRVGATVFICSIGQLRKRFVADAHRHSLTVGCYGVNTNRQLQKALHYGADAIITDYPKEMRTYLGR